MKFNALVVAAMVITSVNAAGKGGFPGCLRGKCMSKAESRDNLVNPEAGASKDRDHTKKESSDDSEAGKALACSIIISELEDLEAMILGLAREFDDLLPFFYTITSEMEYWQATQTEGPSEKYGEAKTKLQNTEELDDPSERYIITRDTMRKTQKDLSNLNSNYYTGWLKATVKCDWAKYQSLTSPEKLMEEGSTVIRELELPENMRGTSSKWGF
ncbi:hypothetical protein BASA83_003297 [Batrachochytrium salamandrivorans]|nr:hypothetical protein BASA83_003297 [Batrachochytrium salamandrivorans]